MIAAQYPNGVCPPGQYQIPFQFQVPQQAPASCVLPSHGRNSARITHMIAVGVQVKGKVYYVQSCPVQILSPLNHQVNAMMIEDVQQVRLCCCFSRGNVSLASQTDKNAYASNEVATVTYEVNNDSTQKVDSVNIELICNMKYTARNHRHYNTIKLVQLRGGSVEKKSGFGSKVSPPTAPFQVQFTLPLVNFSSCQTKTLEISYRIRLQAKTGGFTSNPTVEIPVTLYQTASENQADAMVLALQQNCLASPDGSDDINSGGMIIPIMKAVPYNPNVAFQNSASTFEPPDKKLMQPIPVDTTGDGVANAMGYDTTGDGKIDALDTNFDGAIDTRLS